MRIQPHVLPKMAGRSVAVSSFSPNGDYLAYSSPDGILKLWETSTGNPIQEFSPSKHLTATCTCLQWGPGRHLKSPQTPRKKKKRKSGVETAVDNLDLIAIGTTSGTVLLYSFARGQVHTHLERGHTDEVTDVCWHPAGVILYSCSLDGHVVEWDVSSSQVKEKWKANTGGVHAMCLCSSSRLLTASRVIKMWDLHTRSLLQKFTGHATEVMTLLPVLNTVPSDADDGDGEQFSCSYFLSAASNDRVVNAWYCHQDSKEKNAVTSFSLSDEPLSLNIQTSREQTLTLAAVTRRGQALVFEHKLNGKLKKPLKPKTVVQAATSSNKDEVPVPVPILAALPKDEDGPGLLVAHGSFLKPKFEKVALSPSQPEIVLVVASPVKKSVKGEFQQVKTPDLSSGSTVMYPGQMAPQGPSMEPARRKRKPSASELTLEERLNAISVDKPDQSPRKPPKADTLVNLLTQGLQSKDGKILTNVLQERNERIIANTIKRLPVQVVIPLVKELSQRMHGHAQSGQTVMRWIKPVLSMHSSYLITFPEMIETLGELYQMVDWRTQPSPRLSGLQGRLDLLLSQVTSQTQEEEEPAASAPLLVYQDDSSEEDVPMEFGASESEDNWEDLSDME